MDADKPSDTHDGASCDYDPQLAASDEGSDKANADTSPDKEMPYQLLPPVSADPSVPDPTEYIHSSSPSRTPVPVRPALGSLPGTPMLMLSPHTTPGRPTPVSIPVSAAMLKAMHRSLSSSSGLFTPKNEAEDTSPPESDDEKRVSDSLEVALANEEEASTENEMLAENGEKPADEQATTDETMVAVDADAISPQRRAVSEDQKAIMGVPRQTAGGAVNGDSGIQHGTVSRRPKHDFPSETGSSASEELELMYPFESEPEEDVAPGFSDDNHARDFSHYPTTFDSINSKVASLPDREPTPTARDSLKNSEPEASNPEASPMVDRPALNEEGVEPPGNGRSSVDAKFPSVTSLSNPDAQLEEDPFKLMGSESTVAPGAVDVDDDESDESGDTTDIEQ
jgi:hypothetical protein